MSRLVNPALFLEWVLWAKPELTDGEKHVVWQLRRGDRYRRLGIEFIDRVMSRNEAADQLSVFYPASEMRCKNNHLWSENERVKANGRTVCKSCKRDSDKRRQFTPYQMDLF